MYELLQTYGKRTRADEIATVEIVGDGLVDFRGKRIDLRTGQSRGRPPGFYASRDGRYFVYADGGMKLCHADGRSFLLPHPTLPPYPLVWVGRWLVFQDDPRHQNDLAVLDTDTGAIRGRIEGLLVEHGLKYPQVVPVGDEAVWIVEAPHARLWDLRAMGWRETIAAPTGTTLKGLAPLPEGGFVAGLRRGDDLERDVLARLDGEGSVARSIAAPWVNFARVGETIVSFSTKERRFRVLDPALVEIETLEHDDDFATIHPLPSGREWIAVGGHAQWHHFGEPSLRPMESATKPTTPKPTAKRPATKKTRG